MGKLCVPPGVSEECKPGCHNAGDIHNWCPDENRWWHCNGYPSSRLDQMLRVQLKWFPGRYNEVVFDVRRLVRLWPRGIEAIVYPVESAERTRPEAEAVRELFIQAYGVDAENVAVLQYDLSVNVSDVFVVPPSTNDTLNATRSPREIHRL